MNVKKFVLAACLLVAGLWITTGWMLGERFDGGSGHPPQGHPPASGAAGEPAKTPVVVRGVEQPRSAQASPAVPLPPQRIPSQPGSLAIDAFADGGPAPVIVTPIEGPEHPPPEAADLERDPASRGG